jgi:hypothetical protein
MSTAGVHSSRGDAYQTTVAAGWAICALYEPIEWIELDSTSLDPSGNAVSVDDIVIAHADQRRVYCQCKKNSPAHDKWTPSSLERTISRKPDSSLPVIRPALSGSTLVTTSGISPD